MILDDLVAATRRRLNRHQQQVPLATLQARVAALSPQSAVPVYTALKGPQLKLIAEVKAASPSKGAIATTFDPGAIAEAYARGGADAISVLTEPDYFHGQLADLTAVRQRVPLPLLRKDFTIDPYMLYEARLAGANLILLIVAVLTDTQLRAFLTLAHQLGLAALVEVHDHPELQRALAAGARMIGVNNRDLRDFSVDLTRSLALRPAVPDTVVFVAESGIRTPADTARLQVAGVDAVLVGETLMRAADKSAMIQALKGGSPHD
ncbi:indole-3-glycerol phosphate synthase TrpC [Lacticaseibacillus daqingensis]|uniref:indole-3-glycerol phosphate synthase TrpC n=1 Tax=Lacticaseibacillus daqingensis TaxID=2486014 RepID=UPI000F77E7EE|nr:indole-3-glycerol phosphate synthase TrpC [Lacticaseibacillus daqingensis]